jgi:hypothetical protein
MPSFGQIWFCALDAAPLYALIRERRPARFYGVGSWESTLFAAQAIRDGAANTALVSIDPHPRAEVEAVCDEVVQLPLERSDLARFGRLGAGDVLVVDSSHVARQGAT